MASVMFASNAGILAVRNIEGGVPALVSISGPGGELTQLDSVIVRTIGVTQDVSAQFVTSLQKVVYVYCFGDKMGQITVGGLAFSRVCSSGAPTGDMKGTTDLMNYYDASRAVDEKRVMKVMLGGHTFQGYLLAMNLQTEDTSMRTFNFGFTITTVPKQIGLDSLATTGGIQAGNAGNTTGVA